MHICFNTFLLYITIKDIKEQIFALSLRWGYQPIKCTESSDNQTTACPDNVDSE